MCANGSRGKSALVGYFVNGFTCFEHFQRNAIGFSLWAFFLFSHVSCRSFRPFLTPIYALYSSICINFKNCLPYFSAFEGPMPFISTSQFSVNGKIISHFGLMICSRLLIKSVSHQAHKVCLRKSLIDKKCWLGFCDATALLEDVLE